MEDKTTNYAVHSGLTRDQVDSQLFLDRSLYEESANKRFSLLDSDYPLFAKDEFKYPLHGNQIIAKSIRNIISSEIKEWQSKDEIVIADLGAAGGAITSLFLLNKLKELNLIDKVRLILVDISKEALLATKNGQFQLPVEYFKEMNWTIADNLPILMKKLANSEIRIESLFNLDSLKDKVDICLCGFTHHHLNLNDKESASQEMEKITKKGGIIGVVDEQMSYEEYIAWIKNQEGRQNSRGESIPIAIESFIPLNELLSFYNNTKITDSGNGKFYHYFSGVKQ